VGNDLDRGPGTGAPGTTASRTTRASIRNDSRRTVEVFRGATCDNGAPIGTVGPGSASGVTPRHAEGVFVKNGVVASFRVTGHHHKGDFKDDFR
jgi:hypothetical protein